MGKCDFLTIFFLTHITSRKKWFSSLIIKRTHFKDWYNANKERKNDWRPQYYTIKVQYHQEMGIDLYMIEKKRKK